MFIRYAEVGALPAGATVSAVRSNLKRREMLARLPVLPLSILVLVVTLVAVLTSFLPGQSGQVIFNVPAVKSAPIHADTAPLDVGLSPDDRLSASNSLAPMVAAYRWRHHSRHTRSHVFADRMNVADVNGDGSGSEQPNALAGAFAEPQSADDTASRTD